MSNNPPRKGDWQDVILSKLTRFSEERKMCSVLLLVTQMVFFGEIAVFILLS